MQSTELKSLDDLVRHVGRYPEGAFLFVREGLGFATEQLHGPETSAHRQLHEYLSEHDLDWSDLAGQYYSGTLPEVLTLAIQEAGGWEKMNRHISGRELCWGLRDYALRRWGLLAREVLGQWNIVRTSDFGRIVFGFIDFELMQKQAGDSIEDFFDIFDFEQAFEGSYKTALTRGDGNEAPPSSPS